MKNPTVAPGDIVRSLNGAPHQYVVAGIRRGYLALRDPRTGHLASAPVGSVEVVPAADQDEAALALREVLA